MDILLSVFDQDGGNTPTSTKRMKHRAVSVDYLATTFLEEVFNAGYCWESTVYELEDFDNEQQLGFIRQKGMGVKCPHDGKYGAAYVDCVEEQYVGEATHMLSYSWWYSIGDIIDTLVDFCETNNLNQENTYVWMCCLCVNQHRLAEQQRKGQDTSSRQVDEAEQRIQEIGHVLAMMAPWQEPVYLSRAWCIFELYTAQQYDCVVDIVMPPEERENMEQDILFNEGDLDILNATIANTNILTANAAAETDKMAIFGRISSSREINEAVIQLLQKWLSQDVVLPLFLQKMETSNSTYINMCNTLGLLWCERGEYAIALKCWQCVSAEHRAASRDSIVPVRPSMVQRSIDAMMPLLAAEAVTPAARRATAVPPPPLPSSATGRAMRRATVGVTTATPTSETATAPTVAATATPGIKEEVPSQEEAAKQTNVATSGGAPSTVTTPTTAMAAIKTVATKPTKLDESKAGAPEGDVPGLLPMPSEHCSPISPPKDIASPISVDALLNTPGGKNSSPAVPVRTAASAAAETLAVPALTNATATATGSLKGIIPRKTLSPNENAEPAATALLAAAALGSMFPASKEVPSPPAIPSTAAMSENNWRALQQKTIAL